MSWRYDPFLCAKPKTSENIKWYSPLEAPFRVSGLAFLEENKNFYRLPVARMPEKVTLYPDGKAKTFLEKDWGVAILASNPAGGQVQFVSDAKQVWVHYEVESPPDIPDRMPAAGMTGFDLYVKEDNGDWKYLGVPYATYKGTVFTLGLSNMQLSKKKREFLIHFPLYHGVKSLSIGLEDASEPEPPRQWNSSKKILWYGTSINQGGCASNPGMTAASILSRVWNCEVYNFGFSGSAHCEPEFAEILAQIPDLQAFIVDCCWNMGFEELQAALGNFLDIIRKHYPELPLHLISHTPGHGNYEADMYFNPEVTVTWKKKRKFMRDEAAKRRAAGDKNIFFIDGDYLLGDDWFNGTVDICHLTNLGFYRESERCALPLLIGRNALDVTVTEGGVSDAEAEMTALFPEIFGGRSQITVKESRALTRYCGFMHLLYRLAGKSSSEISEAAYGVDIVGLKRELVSEEEAVLISNNSTMYSLPQQIVLKGDCKSEYMLVIPEKLPRQLDAVFENGRCILSLPELSPKEHAVICPRKAML